VVTIFALAAALLYGSADFLGGVATRRARVLAVLPLSAGAGAVVMIAAVLPSGEPLRLAGLGWGVAAGAVGGVGLIIFYAGLAAGPMTVVAPVSARMSTVLPLAVALAGGERLTALEYAGAVGCLAAIVLVSSADAKSPAGQARRRPGVLGVLAGTGFHGRAVSYGLGAGTTFGLFFLFIRYAGQSGALWPVASARLAGLAVVLAAAAVTRTRPVLPRASPRLLAATAGSGILDATANISYVLATRAGLFGLAVVLTSLYPGITVLLARLVLAERMRAAQRVGLVLAAAGVVLVTV
jgi:drug/metabolite transporter (DMT)-like permease